MKIKFTLILLIAVAGLAAGSDDLRQIYNLGAMVASVSAARLWHGSSTAHGNWPETCSMKSFDDKDVSEHMEPVTAAADQKVIAEYTFDESSSVDIVMVTQGECVRDMMDIITDPTARLATM